MGIEIERKFLVNGESWKQGVQGVVFKQGYLQTRPCTVRVRTEGERGVLTIKGPTHGFSRAEYEYEIPYSEAMELLAQFSLYPILHKVRYRVPYAGKLWEIDEFFAANAGLVLAEIELESEDEPFERPFWLGKEVSGDSRYANSALAREPFTTWEKPAEEMK